MVDSKRNEDRQDSEERNTNHAEKDNKEILRTQLKGRLKNESVAIEGKQLYIPPAGRVDYGFQFCYNNKLAMFGCKQGNLHGFWRQMSREEQTKVKKDITGTALSQLKPYYSSHEQITFVSQAKLAKAIEQFFQTLQLSPEKIKARKKERAGSAEDAPTFQLQAGDEIGGEASGLIHDLKTYLKQLIA